MVARRLDQPLRLFRAILQRKGGRHAEGIKGMDIAARGQNLGRPDQIAARHRFDEAARQRAHQPGQFGFLPQQMFDP
jgi:hypothetical protein